MRCEGMTIKRQAVTIKREEVAISRQAVNKKREDTELGQRQGGLPGEVLPADRGRMGIVGWMTQGPKGGPTGWGRMMRLERPSRNGWQIRSHRQGAA